MKIRGLEPWQQPVFWVVVILVAPFVLIFVAWRAARRRIWAGKIFAKED